MTPKEFLVTDLEVKTKGLSWIDNMYQKFEAICDEMDENSSLLLQETKQYVEKQVNVVGKNVRKLYSEVIQDILPPSPDAEGKNFGSDVSIGFVDEFELFEKAKLGSKTIQTTVAEDHVPNLPASKDSEPKSAVSIPCIKKNQDFDKELPSEIVLLDATEKQLSLTPMKESDSMMFASDRLNEINQDQHEEASSQILTPDACKQEMDLFEMNGSYLKTPAYDASTGSNNALYLEEPSELVDTDSQLSMCHVEGVHDCEEGNNKVKQVSKLHTQIGQRLSQDVLLADGKEFIDHDNKCTFREPAGFKTQYKQEFNDQCGQHNLHVDTNPMPRDALLERPRENEEMDLSKKAIICQQNCEALGENTGISTVQPLVPCDTSLHKESFIEVFCESEDEEESAYWYENENTVEEKHSSAGVSPVSFLASDINKLKHTESCDSEWELI
eukprot:TRINITY_DN11011_c0_g1_i1.p1 TRINITY_DN11011_c0_g1~~TRINITY_DN11011_c0_g1_i1.p1  ORF type:complete len:442 (-),score=120.54 TRINITY_DN11011_c0_g1_i1:457-1782(-)